MVFMCKCAFKPSFTHSTSAMFYSIKREVFKIVMENPWRLSDLAYRDRLLNLTLYDPKRRSSNDAKDLNWLWVKIVRERMLALLNNLHVRQTFATCEESILANQNMVVISRSTTGYDYDNGWKDCDTLILIFHEGRGVGGSLWYLEGCIRSFSKFKNTRKALISGQERTLIFKNADIFPVKKHPFYQNTDIGWTYFNFRFYNPLPY